MLHRKQFMVAVTLAGALWAQAAGAQCTVTHGASKSVLVVAKRSTQFDVSDDSRTIGSLKLKSGRINLYDSRGNKVGSVKKSGSDFTLDDRAGKKVAKMSSKEGGWRVKDAADKTLIKIKPRDDGFKVGDKAGDGLAKGKKKGETIELSTTPMITAW